MQDCKYKIHFLITAYDAGVNLLVELLWGGVSDINGFSNFLLWSHNSMYCRIAWCKIKAFFRCIIINEFTHSQRKHTTFRQLNWVTQDPLFFYCSLLATSLLLYCNLSLRSRSTNCSTLALDSTQLKTWGLSPPPSIHHVQLKFPTFVFFLIAQWDPKGPRGVVW